MTTANRPSPQETVERALAAAKSDDCVVIAEETSTANLRWAGNTLTTNGVAGSRQLTVIAIDRRGAGNGPSAATGVVSRAGVRPDQIEDVVREAEHAAAEATAADDAGELIGARLRRRARADAACRRGGEPEALRVRRAPAAEHLPRHLGRAAAAA